MAKCGLFLADHSSLQAARATNIVAFDGKDWHTFGDGVGLTHGPQFDEVLAIEAYQGNLYVGGSFDTASGVAANNVAYWDGTSWHPLGVGASSIVTALHCYQDKLFVGGYFNSVGGIPFSGGLATWDGTDWNGFHPIATFGGTGNVSSLEVV
ncbi:MAG: hypothetical protein AB7N71_09545, partial [Phycisphaerae bacterium]